jgi:hypothetical protein
MTSWVKRKKRGASVAVKTHLFLEQKLMNTESRLYAGYTYATTIWMIRKHSECVQSMFRAQRIRTARAANR